MKRDTFVHSSVAMVLLLYVCVEGGIQYYCSLICAERDTFVVMFLLKEALFLCFLLLRCYCSLMCAGGGELEGDRLVELATEFAT